MEILKYILENMEEFLKKINFEISQEKAKNIEELDEFLKVERENGETNCEYLARIGFFDEISKNQNKNLIFDGKLQPVFSINDMIFEKVYVETPLDTDKDGKRDLIAVYIKRPKETLNGMKIPAIYVANPYMMKCIEEVYENKLYKVDKDLEVFLGQEEKKIEEIEEKLPSERKSLGEAEISPTEKIELDCITEWYEYFNSRGVASVFSAGVGTDGSEGINSAGSKEEQKWVIAVIEWLNGKRKAYTDRENNIEIKASWCNGKVAMTGKSYLGTLSIAAGVTGVDGLKTIIPQAAISNWYNYYRMNGVTASPLGWQGDDADLLTEYCRSRKDFTVEQKILAEKKLEEMRLASNRENGNYNEYWRERDYLQDISKMKASVFIVHGINDWNVKTNQCYNLWKELKKYEIPSKMILHQGEHIYIDGLKGIKFNDIMNMWIAYWLCDVKNDVLEKIPEVLIQSNIDQNTWFKIDKSQKIEEKIYKVDKTQTLNMIETNMEASEKILELVDDIEELGFSREKENYSSWEKHLVLDSDKKAKSSYLTGNLKEDITIFGDIKVELDIVSKQNKGLISVMLVEYGKRKRLTANQKFLEDNFIILGRDSSTTNKFIFQEEEIESEYKIISRGHLNLQNRDGNSIKKDIILDKEYKYEIDMIPTNYVLSKGSRLGLIIYGTDVEITQRPLEKMRYLIKENSIKLKLNTI